MPRKSRRRSRKVRRKVRRKGSRSRKVRRKGSRSRKVRRKKTHKGRKVNAFFKLMLEAKAARKAVFKYKNKKYKARTTKTGMIVYKRM